MKEKAVKQKVNRRKLQKNHGESKRDLLCKNEQEETKRDMWRKNERKTNVWYKPVEYCEGKSSMLSCSGSGGGDEASDIGVEGVSDKERGGGPEARDAEENDDDKDDNDDEEEKGEEATLEDKDATLE
jgi:hypothetical protein